MTCNFSYEFRLRVLLTPDGALKLISRIRNIGYKTFCFSIAYHTYFLVSDIGEVRIEGLETLDYLDNLQHKERFTEQGDALTFEREVKPLLYSCFPQKRITLQKDSLCKKTTLIHF